MSSVTRSSTPRRSTNTFLCVLTRMSLTVGSRSSGSSGPRPKTSSSSSANSVSRSDRLIGVFSSAEQLCEQRPDFVLGARALGLRERLEIQAVEQLAMDLPPELQVLLARLWCTRWRRRLPAAPNEGATEMPKCCLKHSGLPDGHDAFETQWTFAALATRFARRRRD